MRKKERKKENKKDERERSKEGKDGLFRVTLQWRLPSVFSSSQKP